MPAQLLVRATREWGETYVVAGPESVASSSRPPACAFRPSERTAEEIEIIYEELLHIKALSHLSYMVKRELASVLVFESHAKAGTVRESSLVSLSCQR